MKRLVGYDAESQEHSSETLRHYLYGGHVADYMRHLMEDDEEKYKAHFSRFIKEGITADNVSIRLLAHLLRIYITCTHTYTNTHSLHSLIRTYSHTHSHSWTYMYSHSHNYSSAHTHMHKLLVGLKYSKSYAVTMIDTVLWLWSFTTLKIQYLLSLTRIYHHTSNVFQLCVLCSLGVGKLLMCDVCMLLFWLLPKENMMMAVCYSGYWEKIVFVLPHCIS